MKILEVCSLSKRYGDMLAVDDISFGLASGELLALIGPNGAGKTTTFNMVNGQLRPSAGTVRFKGRDITRLSPHRIARLGVGRSFQIAATFASLRVVENVQLALLAHHRRIFSFLRPAAALYREQAMQLLEQLDMVGHARRPCSELAYGDIKRVELAIALASQPALLLMDEPTAGMAPAERNSLMALIKRLVQERNIAVLYTEHSMDMVFRYSDRILVLAQGRLIAEGDVAHIRQHSKVKEVYFGSAASAGEPADGACA